MARGTGTVLVKFLGDTSDLKKKTDDAEGHLSKIGDKIGDVAKTAAVGGIPALVGFGVASVKAFAESEQVAAQTANVIRSTGGAAKVTAGQVSALASDISKMSGIDDEAIQSGENLLLTFTNIQDRAGKGNKIFSQATGIMADMSVALGQDMTASAMQLGKALNDPIKGVTALQRVGVTFTDEQKKQIKTMQESGNVAGAQRVILEELRKEFGGSAKAAGDTFAGSLNKLKVMAGNFMEEVGGRLVPILTQVGQFLGDNLPQAIDRLRPIWQGLADFVTGFTKGIDDFGSTQSTMASWGAVAFEWFLKVKDALEILRKVFSDVFTAISGWLDEHRTQIQAVFTEVVGVFTSAFGAIQAVVGAAVNFLRGVWRVFGDDLKSFAREGWATIVETFRGAFNTISGIFDLIKAVFTGKWGDAWTALKKIVDGAWDTIFGVVRGAVTNTIPTIIAAAGQVISSAARTAFDGLKDVFKAAINWIIDRWNGLEFKAPHLPGLPDVTIGVPDIPRLASGGTFSGAALVGEAGPELLVGSGRVIPNNQLGGITINVSGALDPASVARQIQAILLEEKRRSGALGLA